MTTTDATTEALIACMDSLGAGTASAYETCIDGLSSQVDYWMHRAEQAEAKLARVQANLDRIIGG